MNRSYDPEVFREAYHLCPTADEEIDYAAWINNKNNIMLTSGKDVGCATYDYPGVYSVHWFFREAKGRAAITLARNLLREMFTTYGAETIRGVTPMSIKAARWLAKQVGLTSYGILDYHDAEPHELMCITKEEFMRQESNGS